MALKFCSLSSGSSGNCYLIGSNSTYILIDAGISAKKIADHLSVLSLCPEDLSGIMITHEHADHIKGIDVLAKKHHIPIYANENTVSQMQSLCKYWKLMDFHIFTNNRTFPVGDLNVKAFPVYHDAADTVGFSVSNGQTRICTATDTGHITEEILSELSSADLMVIEANHDEEILKMGRYPWFLKQRILGQNGHLSNEAAGSAIAKSVLSNPKSRRVLLAHLSRENNFPEMAYQTILNVLETKNIFPGDDLKIELLKRDEMSVVYDFI